MPFHERAVTANRVSTSASTHDLTDEIPSDLIYDIVIRDGSLLDGTGATASPADIGIIGERIVAIGDLSHASAHRNIDASGQRVAPGFIDIHTHSDISATYDPHQASALGMGVTLQVVGNCGISMGLALDNDRFAFERRWLAPYRARITWDSFEAHLRLVEETGYGTNYLPLVGHGSLRKRVVGLDERPATRTEMGEMLALLDDAMRAGAWGFTSGLEYPPSAYGDIDELTDLCRLVGKYGGFYATHLRNEGDTLVEAVTEALEVAERASIPLQLSHHKTEGQKNWGKVRTTLAMVERARERGMDVQLDQYPYTAFMTLLTIQILPREALGGAPEDIAARLSDPVQRTAIRAEMLNAHPEWVEGGAESFWNNLVVGVCRQFPEIQGKTLAQLGWETGTLPIDYALELLALTGGVVSAVNFAIGEEDIATVLSYPLTSIGSDGVGTHPGGEGNETRIHPRTYGTFPRVLSRYVRELGLLTEAEAIFRMTGLPARRLGLTNRGLLRPGYFADIVIYDPTTISDAATFEDPHRYATGIHTVLVNGKIGFRDSGPTSALAGKVLRKQAKL